MDLHYYAPHQASNVLLPACLHRAPKPWWRKRTCQITIPPTISQSTLAKFSTLDTRFWESLDLVIIQLCGCREIYSKYIAPNGEPANFSRQNSYTALKVYTRSMEQDENREISIYKKFEQLDSSYPGRKYVRTMLDSFEIQGALGYHQCLVHRPLWQSMFSLQHRNPQHTFTEPLLRAMLLGGHAHGIDEPSESASKLDSEINNRHSHQRAYLPSAVFSSTSRGEQFQSQTASNYQKFKAPH